MPEYLAPGVYVEETSFRSKSVEGVSTSTTAFVGFTRQGPFAVDAVPQLLTSFADFEGVHGALGDLSGSAAGTNYVAHAAKVFFAEGGQRLYIARVREALPSAENWAAAFSALLAIKEISIVAAPGSTEFGPGADAIQSQLIAHAESKPAYRFAVLDVPSGLTPDGARTYRGKFDSRSAAFYYPWVRVANPSFDVNDPGSRKELVLPPSGFICGIYSRCDAERGVFKAPGNEVIRSAIGFERNVTASEQETLNPAGVNCLRLFPSRGYRVWGARTASSDPEWKYVNVRRYFLYLEHSIDQGTQWAVFEPHGEALWSQVRLVIESFLNNEWRRGALQGTKPEQAFFVRCDRTTMSQHELDEGRLICLVGVAFVKPAEFVIFRIAHHTAEPQSAPPAEGLVFGDRANVYEMGNFLVHIHDDAGEIVLLGSFAEVSGLSNPVIVERRLENEKPASGRKITGLNKSSDITLKRGVIHARDSKEWLSQMGGTSIKRTLSITLLDEFRRPSQKWTVHNAFPMKLNGPTLSAKGNDVAIEELVLTAEGLES